MTRPMQKSGGESRSLGMLCSDDAGSKRGPAFLLSELKVLDLVV